MLGDHSVLDPPDSIPNSEVKRNSVDGSVGFPHVRVEHRQAFNLALSANQCGAVVQLVRIPACHAGGRGFESRPLRHLFEKPSLTTGFFAFWIKVPLSWLFNPSNSLILLLEPLEQWFILCFLYDSLLVILAVMMAKKEKMSHAPLTFSCCRSTYR